METEPTEIILGHVHSSGGAPVWVTRVFYTTSVPGCNVSTLYSGTGTAPNLKKTYVQISAQREPYSGNKCEYRHSPNKHGSGEPSLFS